MSFSTPGSTWVPKSASQHAEIVLSAINAYLAPVNIKIVPSVGNVIWLFCLAIGEVAALFDTYLTAAKNSFNPALCSDDQLLHMLPVTGLTQISGTPSALVVVFTATADGSLTVPAGTHVQIANQTYLFLVNETTVVPASSSVSIDTTCDTIGPIQVAPGQVVGIAETLTNFASCSNAVFTVVGRDIETLKALRTRVLAGLVTYNNLEGFTLALRELAGIAQCKVYFNGSATTPLALPGSITVPTRTLYIVVLGASNLIAQTWADRSMLPTYGPETQQYETLSGQSFDVHYANAVSATVHVIVYTSSVYERQAGYEIKIREIVEGLTLTSEIGRTVTSEDILFVLANFPYAEINGASVSTDGIVFGRTAVIPANAYPSFVSANIDVTEEP